MKLLLIAIALVICLLIPTQPPKSSPVSGKQPIRKPFIEKVVFTAQTVETPPVASTTPIPIQTTQSVDTSDAKLYIYNHESGNNPASVNSSGCRGLGQACPGSKLPCGNDYACQDAYFTSYMLGRYGTWENARAFWTSHHWW